LKCCGNASLSKVRRSPLWRIFAVIYDFRGPIDYAENGGQGPTVVMVPGSCSTGAAWRPLISHLTNTYRCVTTSLLGYGGTAERRTVEDADISLEADIIESVIRRAGCPVHLVGHSFGAVSALAVALRQPRLLRSLTIVEAVAPEILRHAGEFEHYAAFCNMTSAYSAAFRGGQCNAIERMIDFYGGAGTFAGWPQRLRDYAVETTAVNLLDWSSVYGFAVTPSLLSGIVTPTLIVYGENSHTAVKRANELFADSIRGAITVAVADAAHFLIATHAGDLAGLVTSHFAKT
jgi:pimeloyl-ACP methyl ester carboxylesterase